MIWSLIKVVVFVGLTAAIAFAAAYLVETPGEIRIAFDGREFALEPLGFVVGLLIAFAVFWLVLKVAGFLVALLRMMRGDETALSRYLDRNYEKRGYDALTRGLIAVAGGEAREAQAQAEKARRRLPDRADLTGLLSAQAAELAGNHEKAEAYYRDLLQDDRTRFVGIRGLLHQKLASGQNEKALKLAEKAIELKPKHKGVLQTLFSLQSETGDWGGARRTVAAKVKASMLPRDVADRRHAVLSLSEAREAELTGDIDRARALATDANRLAPAFVPAAVTAARLKAGQGDRKGAEKIIRKAWDSNPHPDLAAAFAALVPDENPAARLKRFRPLTGGVKSSDPEARILSAELLIAAEDFPAARRALGDLAETKPNSRTLAIMAAVERGAGASDTVVRGWLARALTAPRGEQWICGKCRHVHVAWTPTCENCDAFDTLSWEEQPASEAATAGSAAMLPLIVGAAPEPAPEDAPFEGHAEAPDPAADAAAAGDPAPDADGEKPGSGTDPDKHKVA